MARDKGKLEDELPAEVAGIDNAADEFAPVANVLRGDVRDAMLNVIRNATDWGKFDERRQRDIATAVNNAAEQLVAKAVKAIASEGREQVQLKLEQVTVKDGLKVSCSGGFTHDALVLLGEAQGKSVLLTVADASAFDGQRREPEITPDQPDLIPEDDSDLVAAADPPGDAEDEGAVFADDAEDELVSVA